MNEPIQLETQEIYEYCEDFNIKPCPCEAYGDICTCIIAASIEVAENLIS